MQRQKEWVPQPIWIEDVAINHDSIIYILMLIQSWSLSSGLDLEE